MEELFKYYIENNIVNTVYKNTFLKKIYYRLLMFFYMTPLILIIFNLVILVFTFLLRGQYYVPRLFALEFVSLSVLYLLKIFVEKLIVSYKNKCILRSGINIYESRENFVNHKEEELIRDYLQDHHMLDIGIILGIEQYLITRKNSKIIINGQKFNVYTFIATIICSFLLTRLVDSTELVNIIIEINSRGYKIGNIVLIILICVLLYILLTFFQFLFNQIQKTNLENMNFNMNANENAILRILQALRMDLKE